MTELAEHGGAATRDLSDLVSAYERDGFVNGGKVLSDVAIDRASEDLERYADKIVRGEPGQTAEWGAGHFQILGMRDRSPAFRELSESQPMLTIAAALVKSPLIQLWADVVHYKAPLKGGVVNWHQDGPYHQGVRPAHRIISAWIALDDANEETGCMSMVPGSHKWGNQKAHMLRHEQTPGATPFAVPPAPEGVSERASPIPCPVRRGEVHFHHAFTWHGSPMNRSPRPRRGFTMFLLSGDVRAFGETRANLPEGTYMREASKHYPILYRA